LRSARERSLPPAIPPPRIADLRRAEAGKIREGGPVDFFLVHRDPLSYPTALWRVWLVAWTDVH
jgi:hypothetical protein